MAADTLRALSRLYATGDIDREDYRHKRRDLLNRIVSGEQSLTPYQPPEPEAPTVFPYDDDDGDTTQEILPTVDPDSNAGDASQRSGAPFPWLVLVGVVAALAVIGWLVLTEEDPAQAPAPSLTTAPPVAPAPEDDGDLFQSFLSRKVWHPTALTDLQNAFAALDSDTQHSLVAGESGARLTDAIAQQISAERGLLELGDAGDVIETQRGLFALASGLGLDSTRLKRAAEQFARDAAQFSAAAADSASKIPFEPGVPAADTATADETAADEPAVEETPPAEPAASEATEEAGVPEAAASEPAPVPVAAAEPVPAAAPESAAPAAESATAAPATAAPAATGKKRTNCKPELAKTRRPYCIDILADGEKGPVLVVLAPGTFEMGGERDSEQPRHSVTIDYPFALGMFEVSAAELARFCATTGRQCPGQPWGDAELPAVNVDWQLANDYSAWLSTITGATYRLPSESEWEFAARGGTTTAYPFGDELLPTHARYSFKNAEQQPLKANDRSVNRNDFRLYHVVGNVREWVADAWRPNYQGAPTDGSAAAGSGARVARGGSYADPANALRSAARVSLPATTADAYTGFRVVREMP